MTTKKYILGTFSRKYIFQFIIFILTFIFLTVLSFAFCQKATEDFSERQRYKNAELNEIIFSHSPDFEEAFLNFNGSSYAYTGSGRRLNTDIFMSKTDRTYSGNPICFNGGLSANECVLSENLTYKFGLKVGDTLRLAVGGKGESFEFLIKEILPAQKGIDSKYMHEGMLILGENTEFIKNGKYIYTSFAKDADEYKSLVDDSARERSVVLTDEIVKRNGWRLFGYASLSLFLLCVFIAVCELLIFAKMGKKYKDYSILDSYGMSRLKLFGVIFHDLGIKYLLALVLNHLLWFARLSYFGASYFVPATVFLVLSLITVTVLAFIIDRRETIWHKIIN